MYLIYIEKSETHKHFLNVKGNISLANLKFRHDINGLRAIAVIAVMLFHFDEKLLPGGFAGVDVFFVISGFLMTSIIFKGLKQNNFTLIGFYIARANRIIPALVLLCFVVIVFGWFFLPPFEYKALSKHAASSVSFVSNIIYWREAGYFDSDSNGKWLLHTWSLSVEWQFYIIYPFLLVLLKRFCTPKNLRQILVLITVLGSFLSIYLTLHWPEGAYYLLPSRVWEMTLGGLAFLYPNISIINKNKKQAELLGLIMIVSALFLVSRDNAWPGFLAFIPVLGVYIILISNRQNSIITNNIIFQKIGTWSYSIYLWHWPLAVFGYYFEIDNWLYVGIPLSIILGWASFSFVETKKYKSYLCWRDLFRVKPIWFSFVIGLLGSTIFITNGAEFHYPKTVIIASNEVNNFSPYRNKCFSDSQICYFKGNKITQELDTVDYIIFGDSHSLAILTSVINAIGGDKKSVYIGSSACLFIPNLYSSFYDTSLCKNKTKKLYDEIIPKNHDAKLIMIERTNIYFTGYNSHEEEATFKDIRLVSGNNRITLRDQYVNTLCNLADQKKVFVLTPTPEFSHNIPSETAKRLMSLNKNPIELSKKDYIDRNKYTSEIFNQLNNCNVTLLDPTKYVCNENSCFSSFKGRPIYKDDDHLSECGNKLLIPMFKKHLN